MILTSGPFLNHNFNKRPAMNYRRINLYIQWKMTVKNMTSWRHKTLSASFQMLRTFSAWTHLSHFDQSKNKNEMKSLTNAWPWWEKSKATSLPACKSRLNFHIRGQFEIKILMLQLMNITYFTCILKKLNLSCNHFKSSNLSADNFKKVLKLSWSIPEPAIWSGDTGQQIHCFDSCG